MILLHDLGNVATRIRPALEVFAWDPGVANLEDMSALVSPSSAFQSVPFVT